MAGSGLRDSCGSSARGWTCAINGVRAKVSAMMTGGWVYEGQDVSVGVRLMGLRHRRQRGRGCKDNDKGARAMKAVRRQCLNTRERQRHRGWTYLSLSLCLNTLPLYPLCPSCVSQHRSPVL